MHTAAIVLETVAADDADSLASLRVLAMQASLAALGRFDPQRARERFLAGFEPACTWHVRSQAHRVGFVVLRSEEDEIFLDHLYIHPEHQGRGVGGQVLARVLAQADAEAKPVRLGALRGSRSNAFYQRHGFELVEEAEWDNHYVRRPAARASDG